MRVRDFVDVVRDAKTIVLAWDNNGYTFPIRDSGMLSIFGDCKVEYVMISSEPKEYELGLSMALLKEKAT